MSLLMRSYCIVLSCAFHHWPYVILALMLQRGVSRYGGQGRGELAYGEKPLEQQSHGTRPQRRGYPGSLRPDGKVPGVKSGMSIPRVARTFHSPVIVSV
jgi:hypothetical protein